MRPIVARADARRLPLPDASVDAICTDPPYGLEFMGKEWDRLGDDVVSKSWDTRGRRHDNVPQRSPDDPGGRHGVSYKQQNPRCHACGRAMQGRDTAKGFKVCHCTTPQPYAPNTYPVRMQEWHTEWAAEALRVAKPGAHLLAFGGTRTYHRLACAVEDAGWEIRDSIGCLTWMYASGFPKSRDVSKAIDAEAGAAREVVGEDPDFAWRNPRGKWGLGLSHDDNEQVRPGLKALTAPATEDAARWQGWGTALKPSWEPIIVARKPLASTVAGNVLAYGTGALNVDACRVEALTAAEVARSGRSTNGSVYGDFGSVDWKRAGAEHPGRWPTNLVLIHNPDCADRCVDGCHVADLDAQSGQRTSGSRKAGTYGLMGYMGADPAPMPAVAGDSGGASRFYPVFRFQAKAPTRERPVIVRDGQRLSHATIKPVGLMRWLVRLVTPPGGTVLDPFCGSGPTLEAALVEGFRPVGFDTDPDAMEWTTKRLRKPLQPDLFGT